MHTTSPPKVAAATVTIAPTLKNLVTENQKLRTSRDMMAHLLSVVTSWINEYKGGTMRTMTELEEVENHQLVVFFLMLMVRLQGGMTSVLKKDGQQQMQQGEKGANNNDNHHVRGGNNGGTDNG
jgi:hypothetical protein